MVKVGIVHNKFILTNNIDAILLNNGYAVTTTATTYSEAIQMLEKELPDVVLLEIGLNGNTTGIDVAWTLKNEHDIPFIFFIEEWNEQIEAKAKLIEPSAFLTQPFIAPLLLAAIEVGILNHSQKKLRTFEKKDTVKEYIFIKESKNYVKIKIDTITYLESDHIYVVIHTTGKKFTVRSSMKQIIDSIYTHNFLYIHRSYTININYIENINLDYVIVNGINLPIQKNCRKLLLQKLDLK